MRTTWRIGALIVCGVAAATARGDVMFGGNSRSIAMGGAGIAIVDRSERNTLINPAALALLNRRVKVDYPGIGLRASGVPIDKAYDHLFGNPDRNDAVSLARDFGKRNSDFGVGLNWGVRFGHVDAQVTGLASVHIVPNEALKTWAQTANGDVTRLTGAERADLLGAGIYSLPNIGIAERVSPAGSPTRIEAGARIKLERAVYSHYVVNSTNIALNTPAATAPEMGSGTTLTKDGIGVDFGLLAHPREHAGLSGALVVTNLIEPPFRFNGTVAGGAPYRYDLQPRSISIGSAWEGGKLLGAFDVVDLSRAYGNVQARLGMEYRSRGIALRAGYASARGFTVGLGWGWFDIAIGARAPLLVTETLRF